MRRHDCVHNLDTPLVCFEKHQLMTMKCAYSSAKLQCCVPRAHRHYTRAFFKNTQQQIVDAKPRNKQIICNLRFQREIKLVRLQLNNNSQYFAISDQLEKQEYKQSQSFVSRGNRYNSSLWRVLSENRLERKRRSDQSKQEVKAVKRVEKHTNESQKGHQIRQNTAGGTRKRTIKGISKKANI